jgi:hypothetical protein
LKLEVIHSLEQLNGNIALESLKVINSLEKLSHLRVVNMLNDFTRGTFFVIPGTILVPFFEIAEVEAESE